LFDTYEKVKIKIKVKIPHFFALSKHAILVHFYLENEAYIFSDIPNFFNYFKYETYLILYIAVLMFI